MHSRYRICRLCGDMHDVAAWPDNHRELPPRRSALSAPYFISDTMDGTFHPVNNGVYDSKSEFRKVTRRSGNIEIGNDSNPDKRYVDTVTAEEVNTARQMVEQGYVPHHEHATAGDMESVLP